MVADRTLELLFHGARGLLFDERDFELWQFDYLGFIGIYLLQRLSVVVEGPRIYRFDRGHLMLDPLGLVRIWLRADGLIVEQGRSELMAAKFALVISDPLITGSRRFILTVEILA